jgi:hypothetical protein
VWKTAKVVVRYIILKANIPIIYLSCKWCSHLSPKEKKRFWVLAFSVCEKNKTHTHKLWKKNAFLHNIHLMARSGQNGLEYITFQSFASLIILLAKWVYRLIYLYKIIGVHVFDSVIRDWLEPPPSLESPQPWVEVCEPCNPITSNPLN